MYSTNDPEIGEIPGAGWPEPIVAMIGERDAGFNRVSSVLEEQSYTVVHHDAPGDVLVHLAEGVAAIEAKGAVPPRATVPTLLVFNCGEAPDAWAPIFRASHRLLPGAAILVFVQDEAWDVVRGALAAGADEVISADETRVRELVLTRVRSAFAKSLVACLAEPLRGASGPSALGFPDAATAYVANFAALVCGRSPSRERDWRVWTWSGARTRGSGAGSSLPDRDVVEQAEPDLSASDAERARERVRAAAAVLPEPEERAGPLADVLGVRVPHLRGESGRLDARKVAERLGVSLARLAGATPISRQALTATPDSARAQASLDPIARTLAALEALLPEDRVSAWLNAPHPRLGDEPPLAKILAGEAEQVARMLEAAREGSVD